MKDRMSDYLYAKLNESEERVVEYEKILEDHSMAIKSGVEYLLRAMQLMAGVDFGDKLQYRGVVLMLARHVAEEVDAASLLMKYGSTQPCKSHLRSAFEASIGTKYILETDHERRAICYFVNHIKEKLRVLNKCDPSTQQGKQLRKQITDPIGGGVLQDVEKLGYDFAKERAKYEGVLAKPEYVDVDTEWKAVKKASGRKPSWFSLFGGPRNVRELARHVGLEFFYEFLYSDWSGHIHAGGSIQNIGKNSSDSWENSNALRPIRHPEGLKDVLNFGVFLPCDLGTILSRRFLSPIGRADVKNQYLKSVKPKNDKLAGLTLEVNWK